jgi:hypothetical protein
MSGIPAATQPRTRLQILRAEADAQAALAATATAAADVLPRGAPQAGSATDQALALIAASMARQELSAVASRARATADSAARAAEAEALLAQQRRTAAGAAPAFHGKMGGIEAHRWLTTLDQWFGSAHIDAADDQTRLEVAKAALRDAAQAWWATKTANGTATALGTWDLFSAAVRAHFLPLDVERWAMREREALIAGGTAKGRDVVEYTARFNELDQLLPKVDDLTRVMMYERGLPSTYAVKCAERRFDTLAAATEAMTTLWHARESARHTPASLSNTEIDECKHEPLAAPSTAVSASSSPSSSPFDPVGELRAQVAQLTAMMAERFQASGRGRGRGGRHGGRSRQREGEGESRARSRTPGLSEELVRSRIRAGQCIKCGQKGHYKAECTNEAQLN